MSMAIFPTSSGTRKTLNGAPTLIGTSTHFEAEGVPSQPSHFLDDGYPLESVSMSAILGIKDQTHATPRPQTDILTAREPHFEGEVVMEFEMVIENLGRGSSLMRFPED